MNPFSHDGNDSTDLLRLLDAANHEFMSNEQAAEQIDATGVLADDIVPALPVALDQPETAQQPEAETLDLLPVSGESRKRSFDEMQQETQSELTVTTNDETSDAPVPAVGDEFVSSPKSPKRLKIDQDSPTLAQLSQVQMFSDVNITVRGVAFHGIKAMFALKSERFQKLLFPADGTSVSQLDINDISPSAFRFIKDFCYDMAPAIDISNVVDVLAASEIYGIPSTDEQCKAFLEGIESVDDFLNVLAQFHTVDDWSQNQSVHDVFNHFLVHSERLLQQKGAEIVASEVFRTVPFDGQRMVLQSDHLGVKEEDLFLAVQSWQLYSGEALKSVIRFGLMATDFIVSTVKPTGILTNADLVSLYEKELGLTDECVFEARERFTVKPVKKTPRAKSKSKTRAKSTKSKRKRKSKK